MTLWQNFPNPANPETWFPYRLSETMSVQFEIYDVRGRLIQTIKLGEQPAGTYIDREHAAYWDGRNRMGERVGSGIYLYAMLAGGKRMVRRMVVRR